jgi:hypothetical protein
MKVESKRNFQHRGTDVTEELKGPYDGGTQVLIWRRESHPDEVINFVYDPAVPGSEDEARSKAEKAFGLRGW